LFDPPEGGDFDDDDDDDEAKDFHLFAPRKAPKAEPAKPAAPAAKKPSAPKPEPAAPKSKSEPHWLEKELRKDPLFEKFLAEKYQGGNARVPNPVSENREKYPEVAFSTAMKDGKFRWRVDAEFKRWKAAQQGEPKVEEKPKAEEQHKRAEIGDTLKHLSQLRVGDVIQSERHGAPPRRIVSIHGAHVMAVETGENGDRGEEQMFPASSITSGRHKRVADPATPSAQGRKKEREEKEKAEKAKAVREEKAREKERREKALKRREEQKAKTPAWAQEQDALLDVALEGRVVRSRELGGGINTTVKRTIEHKGKKADFVWKPASGEHEEELRTGVEPGTQYKREVAAYNVDRLLGEGTVVPPTTSNGEGSYQAFSEGAQTFASVAWGGKPPESKVIDSPDFGRMHLLDMLTGHEDRHLGNIMFVDSPGQVRLLAIDNGLCLADTRRKNSPYNYVVVSQWKELYPSAKMKRAVYDATHNIDEELHNRLKDVDHEEYVESIIASGLRDEGAILASLVRLSVLQRDRHFLTQMDDDDDDDEDKVKAPIRRFLLQSAKSPKDLLRDAGPGPSFEELQEVVRHALRR
jgi:hypothetical protein